MMMVMDYSASVLDSPSFLIWKYSITIRYSPTCLPTSVDPWFVHRPAGQVVVVSLVVE
jgi:hypothetical protein